MIDYQDATWQFESEYQGEFPERRVGKTFVCHGRPDDRLLVVENEYGYREQWFVQTKGEEGEYGYVGYGEGGPARLFTDDDKVIDLTLVQRGFGPPRIDGLVTVYRADGTKLSELMYQFGKVLSAEGWYADGSRRMSIKFSDSAEDHRESYWTPEGDLIAEYPGVEFAVVISDGERVLDCGMTIVRVRGGWFMKGAPFGDSDETVPYPESHLLTHLSPFWIATKNVTVGQWVDLMGTQPWLETEHPEVSDNHPACGMSWTEAKEFCRRLGERESLQVALPTSAQWEYACRAGSTTRYWFDEQPAVVPSWPAPRPVGASGPNALGLHDLLTNGQQYCEDRYEEAFFDVGPFDPAGPSCPFGYFMGNRARVVRGGDFDGYSPYWRQEGYTETDSGVDEVGLRIVVVDPAD